MPGSRDHRVRTHAKAQNAATGTADPATGRREPSDLRQPSTALRQTTAVHQQPIRSPSHASAAPPAAHPRPECSEYAALLYHKPHVVTLPAVHIIDAPRYAWRGAMLDVARHFFSIDEVKRYIDLIALYKINRLHLHLADDQGWRLEIKAWPELARRGGASEVGGGQGGYYTQEQYKD